MLHYAFAIILIISESLRINAQTSNKPEYPRGRTPVKELSATIDKKYDFSPSAVKAFNLSGDDTHENIYDIVGGGCSFYCGCAIGELNASSSLKSQGKFNYSAKNIHDLDYGTAWVEGVPGYGENEWIEYTLPANNPTITTVKIANGYIRTKKAWMENSRVKTLELQVDGIPFAMLHLQNVYAEQIFNVGKIAPKDEKPLVLRFIIRSTYPGTRFKDTAISEIYFDGIGVH